MKRTWKEIRRLKIKHLSHAINEVYLEDGSKWEDFKCPCGEMLSKHKYASVEREVQETNKEGVVEVLKSKIIELENSDE